MGFKTSFYVQAKYNHTSSLQERDHLSEETKKKKNMLKVIISMRVALGKSFNYYNFSCSETLNSNIKMFCGIADIKSSNWHNHKFTANYN